MKKIKSQQATKSPKQRLVLNLQNATQRKELPSPQQFKKWLSAVLTFHDITNAIEITVRLVTPKESTNLNYRYRHKQSPTNILSFVNDDNAIYFYPKAANDTQAPLYLGDLVICVALVKKEAHEQDKSFLAHFAHLIIHGTLHCLGYTHDDNKKRVIMENTETTIMQQLGFPNPYEE